MRRRAFTILLSFFLRGRLSKYTNTPQCQLHHLSGTLRTKHPKIPNIPSYGRRGIITLPNKSYHAIQEPDMEKEASFNQNVFNLSLALSQSRINDAMELRCMILGPDGSIKEFEV